MTSTLELAQQDIRDRLADQFVQHCVEGGVPSAEQLERVNGTMVPYLVYNFADFAPTASRSLIGPRGDGYSQPINFYSIGPNLASARALSLKVLDVFLGFQPVNSGAMGKRPGGGAFALRSTNGAEEAFIVMNSFVFTVEFQQIP